MVFHWCLYDNLTEHYMFVHLEMRKFSFRGLKTIPLTLCNVLYLKMWCKSEMIYKSKHKICK